MEVTSTSNKFQPAIPQSFASDYVGDTSHFCRALDHFRRTTGSRVLFHELPPNERSLVLETSQLFKAGLDLCEGCDQWGHHENVNSIECADLGTICDLKSERLLCLRHFEEWRL